MRRLPAQQPCLYTKLPFAASCHSVSARHLDNSEQQPGLSRLSSGAFHLRTLHGRRWGPSTEKAAVVQVYQIRPAVHLRLATILHSLLRLAHPLPAENLAWEVLGICTWDFCMPSTRDESLQSRLPLNLGGPAFRLGQSCLFSTKQGVIIVRRAFTSLST